MRKKNFPEKVKAKRPFERTVHGMKAGHNSQGLLTIVAIRKKINLYFHSTHLKKTAALLGLYAAVACFATWPLIANLKNCMPIGGVRYGTIVLFNLWTLDWNARMLGHAGYWDAPIFYPEKGAFALSEPMPVTGLLYAPFKAVTGNPVTAYDLALLAILTLNGFMAYRLLRQIGAGESGAILTGVLGVFTPFVFDQLEVIQLTVLFPLFGGLAALQVIKDLAPVEQGR